MNEVVEGEELVDFVKSLIALFLKLCGIDRVVIHNGDKGDLIGYVAQVGSDIDYVIVEACLEKLGVRFVLDELWRVQEGVRCRCHQVVRIRNALTPAGLSPLPHFILYEDLYIKVSLRSFLIPADLTKDLVDVTKKRFPIPVLIILFVDHQANIDVLPRGAVLL